jgi:hypothetical protein
MKNCFCMEWPYRAECAELRAKLDAAVSQSERVRTEASESETSHAEERRLRESAESERDAARAELAATRVSGAFIFTPVPVRPRRRGERHFLRTHFISSRRRSRTSLPFFELHP